MYMMSRRTLLLITAATLSVTLSGCAEERVTQLEAKVEALQKQVDRHEAILQSRLADERAAKENTAAATTDTTSATGTVSATDTSDATAGESTTTSGTAAASKSYSDISGIHGEQQINDLIKLEVLDTTGGKFEPGKPVTRAEFVEWLVKSNNKIKPDSPVKLAEADSRSWFPDMAPTHPDFKYVQGMADAGWSIGFKDKTFKPDKPLTREEMIAIKAAFDGLPLSSNGAEWMLGKTWTDWRKINQDFIDAMAREAGSQNNWERCFGKTKVADPQKPVTRAEAAVCVWQIGRFPVTAAAKLKS